MDKWQEFFTQIAKTNAFQSTCLRRKVGAVIVRDNTIISTGYNGAPRGVKHCIDRGCLRERLQVPSGQRHELCFGAHAEANAITSAAKYGISINRAILYCTTYPCSQCAKSIINCGIKEVYYIDGYADEITSILFSEADVKCCRLD